MADGVKPPNLRRTSAYNLAESGGTFMSTTRIFETAGQRGLLRADGQGDSNPTLLRARGDVVAATRHPTGLYRTIADIMRGGDPFTAAFQKPRDAAGCPATPRENVLPCVGGATTPVDINAGPASLGHHAHRRARLTTCGLSFANMVVRPKRHRADARRPPTTSFPARNLPGTTMVGYRDNRPHLLVCFRRTRTTSDTAPRTMGSGSSALRSPRGLVLPRARADHHRPGRRSSLRHAHPACIFVPSYD